VAGEVPVEVDGGAEEEGEGEGERRTERHGVSCSVAPAYARSFKRWVGSASGR